MLTRKHYRELADVIDRGITSKKNEKQDIETAKDVVFKLCRILRKGNERFNTDKFLEACGIG